VGGAGAAGGAGTLVDPAATTGSPEPSGFAATVAEAEAAADGGSKAPLDVDGAMGRVVPEENARTATTPAIAAAATIPAVQTRARADFTAAS
jgi:hypothetical protein